MANSFSILAWKISWSGAWWATVHRVAKSQMTEYTNAITRYSCLFSVF